MTGVMTQNSGLPVWVWLHWALGDDGEVMPWGWMLPLIQSEGVMIC